MNNRLTIPRKRLLLTPSRRSLLRGLGASIAAPYVAKAQFNQGQSLGSAGVANSVGGGGGGGYVAKAVHFDGATFLSIGTLAASDSPFISSARWFRSSTPPETGQYGLYDFDPADVEAPVLEISPLGRIHWYAKGPISYDEFTSADGAFPFDGQWHSLLTAFDTNHGIGAKIGMFYLDDVLVPGTWTTDFDDAFSNSFGVKLGVPDTTEDYPVVFVGDLADVRVMPGQFIDFSNTTNRRLFVSATNKPVDPAIATAALGASGAVLLSGDKDSFPVNQGTGGVFTLTGTLTNASTSPSD